MRRAAAIRENCDPDEEHGDNEGTGEGHGLLLIVLV